MFLWEWRDFPSASCVCSVYYRGADKSLARPGRKHASVSVIMAWNLLGALPCRKRNLMTTGVSMLLKSRASLTCLLVCFLSGTAKDLSALRHNKTDYSATKLDYPVFVHILMTKKMLFTHGRTPTIVYVDAIFETNDQWSWQSCFVPSVWLIYQTVQHMLMKSGTLI